MSTNKKTPVDRAPDANRFKYLSPEPRPKMPAGYTAELDLRSTRVRIREERERRASS